MEIILGSPQLKAKNLNFKLGVPGAAGLELRAPLQWVPIRGGLGINMKI